MNAATTPTIDIDQDTARDALFAHLMRGGMFGHYWTPDGEPYVKDGRELRERYTQWIDLGNPKPPIDSWLEKNLYWGVHPTTTKGADLDKKPNKRRSSVAIIAAVNCFFAEYDGKDYVQPDEYAPYLPGNFNDFAEHDQKTIIKEARKAAFPLAADRYKARAWQHIAQMPLAPSAIVDSGGGYHVYHLLAEPAIINSENRQHIADVQAAWVHLVGSDPSSKDLARVLRVPGTHNRKAYFSPDFPPCSIVVAEFDRLYALEDFEQLTDGLRVERVARPVSIGSTNGYHGDDYETAVDALRRLSPWRCDDRDEWIRVGMALKAGLGDAGLELWDQWSQGSRKYVPGDCDGRWKTLRPSNTTLGTLIFRAQEDSPRAKRERAEYEYEYAFAPSAELPDPSTLDGDWSAPVAAAGTKESSARAQAHQTWPYTVKGGRMCLLREDRDGEIEPVPIASFTAQITGQIEDEDGARTFIISGEAVRGGPYRFEFPAERFGKEGELRAALEKAVGPYDPVYNRMSEHLVPAIKILTTETDMETVRRYRRTGWKGGEFLIPGMEPDGTRIELPDKLPYRVSADADQAIATAALTNLIECVDPAISTPVLAMLLQAPIHRPAGWQNERYGVFIQGRTGSLKTSFVQTAMSIYGAGFNHDRTLIKLGEGSTRNAIMAYATCAHDLPLFIDNYKPNTGFGVHDLVNLIHNILEGGEKDRLTRAATIKDARPVHCFPIITGEDVPDHDPATLARQLLVAFEWQAGQPNPKLAAAQADSEELSAIGLLWLTWVCSEEGQRAIKATARFLPAVRDNWAAMLRLLRKDMVNILRVATNLATNELTWSIALQHPVLGELLAPYSKAHGDGLRRIAENMARSTAEALEAVRFLAGLREILATGQATLIDLDSAIGATAHERERMVGWKDGEGVYLLPTVALERIRKVLGPQSIPVSLQVLYSQFEGLHMIASRGKDKVTRSMRMQGEVQRVLHLEPSALLTKADQDEADAAQNEDSAAAGL